MDLHLDPQRLDQVLQALFRGQPVLSVVLAVKYIKPTPGGLINLPTKTFVAGDSTIATGLLQELSEKIEQFALYQREQSDQIQKHLDQQQAGPGAQVWPGELSGEDIPEDWSLN